MIHDGHKIETIIGGKEINMKNIESVNLKRLVKDEIPFDFFKSFIKDLPIIYKAAYEYADNFSPPQAKDLLPYIRRAKIDEHLKNVAEGFEPLEHSICLNQARNCHYVKVEAGSITLTANAVNGPSEMVRQAIFRGTLAVSNQLLLFPDKYNRPKGNSYYAVILHGAENFDESRVAFVYLGFPSFDLETYLTRINLVDYCNIELYPEITEESIEDLAVAKLRDDALIKESIG